MKFLTLSLLAGCWLIAAGEMQAQVVNGIAAIVNEAIITHDDVLNDVARVWELLERTYSRQPEVLNQKKLETYKQSLEELVQRKLILHEFKTAGYILPESVIEDNINDRIREQFGDRVKLTKSLQAQGITSETYRQQIRELFIVDAMRRKNINSGIIISPYKIERYYQTHEDEFKMEDQVKLRMIFLDKSKHETGDKLAKEISSKLDEGVSFAEMATLYSDEPQASQGGDRGWMERKKLRPELDAVAFSLKPGQRSGVIHVEAQDGLPEGYYLMLVEEIHSAHLKPLDDVRGDIERSLVVIENTRLREKWISRLKAKSFVRYFTN
jgi:parvulin-like peptidyl-prolyl isomerase